MVKQTLHTSNAPQPIGPYNQAVRIGDLIYTSGQIPLDLETSAVCEGGIKEQTRLVIGYLQAIAQEAGVGLEAVVKTTVFLKNMEDFPEMNVVYGQFFSEDTAPARSTIEVARLPKDVLVEIEAVISLEK